MITTAALYLIGQGGLLLRDARKYLADDSKQLQQAITDADRTTIIVGGVARNLELESRTWANQEAALANQSSTAINSLNASLRAVNTFTLTATSLLESQSQSLKSLEQTASQSISAMGTSVAQLSPAAQAALSNLNSASQELRDQLSDPAIRATLANLESTSQQVAGVASDAHTETGLIVSQTRQAFKPKNRLLSILKMLGGGTVTGAELVYYMSH